MCNRHSGIKKAYWLIDWSVGRAGRLAGWHLTLCRLHGTLCTAPPLSTCKGRFIKFTMMMIMMMMYSSLFQKQSSSWSSSSSVFSHVDRMPVDRSSCVDELYWSLDGRLFGILRWPVSPFHAVSIFSTVSVNTFLETIHRRCHHHHQSEIVTHVDYSVAEEILS